MLDTINPYLVHIGAFGESYLRGPPRGFVEQGDKPIYFIATGEQMPIFRCTGEQRQYWGTGNIRRQGDRETCMVLYDVMYRMKRNAAQINDIIYYN